MVKALITGVTGQDGSYLADLLLSKGYEVHGVARRSARRMPDYLDKRVILHLGDLTDGSASAIVREVSPAEVYNLAAQSDVRASFDLPEYTLDSIASGTLRMLDASLAVGARFFQASSSEMYGKVLETPQRETTPFNPRSPYGIAKRAAHWLTANYRERGLHASCGILFNHERPRRGETFVTRKITRAVGRIKLGLQDKVHLGNLDAKRDWGFAGDDVEEMWLMMQQEQPDDYVVASASGYPQSLEYF